VSFLLENMGIIVFGANPKSYEPKTLAVYQLEITSLPETGGRTASDFSHAVRKELTEVTQYSFPQGRYQKHEMRGTGARVRLIGKEGPSPWSPELVIDSANPLEKSGKPSSYVALDKNDPEYEKAVIPTIGYTTRDEKGKPMTTISWAAGPPNLTRLPTVFEGKDGKPLAFYLPLKTAAGTDVRIPVFSAVIVIVAAITMWLFHLLIHRTMFGISMRALSHDLNAAKLMGVNTDAVIAGTFAIGGAGAALAGNMVGLYNQTIEPLMGILPGLKAFVAAVVGGIGSIPGAAVGGLIMGVSEALVKATIPARYSSLADALAFAILIVVLLFKPSGLFGRTLKEKV
jgi:hypothetical protein